MISKSQIKLVKQLDTKKHRQREGAFVAEGPKVVGDLMACGYAPRALFATDDFACRLQAEEAAGILTRVTGDELRKLSFLQHPQQVLAVFPLPRPTVEAAANDRLQLVLDGVQDPGNLGTIIRIADWFGIDTIFCSPDTADAWSPKVVQATMGSIARVNVVYTDLLQLLGHTQLPVYGTLLNGQDIYQQPLSDRGFIVMGNEGNGISEPVRRLVSHKLLIPRFSSHSDADSLNVAIATAVTCAEFRRRGHQQTL